jgi:chemotaxis protein CheX
MSAEDEAGLEPFTAAAVVALHEMAGLEAGVADAPECATDVSAAIRLLADVPGGADRWLVVSFPNGTADDLARRILERPADPELVRDCLGELANVIAGQAKAALSGTPAHFKLTTPVTAAGPFATPPGERLAAGIVSEAGVFVLEVRQAK